MLQRRPSGLPLPRGARRRRRPRRGRAGRSAGQDAVVHLAAKVDVVGPVGGLPRDATSRAPARWWPPAAPPAWAGWSTSRPRRSRTRAGRWSASAPSRADPAHARGPLRPLQGGRRARGAGRRLRRRWRCWRSARTWSGDPATPSWSARIVDRARAGRLPVLGSGAALIDTTYVDNAVAALVAAVDACGAVHGEALVVSNGEPRPVARGAGPALPRRRGAAAAPAGARPPSARLAGAAVDGVWAAGRRQRRPADHPVPGRAADHRALVRPAAHPRGAGVDAGGVPRRRLRAARAVVRSTAAGPVRLSVRRVAWPGDSERDPAPRRTS